MKEMTCEIFNGYDDENRATIMMWLEGYYTEEDEPAVIDFNEMAGHMAKLLYCAENPDKSVLNAAEQANGLGHPLAGAISRADLVFPACVMI